MKYTVVQYSTTGGTEVVINEKDILVGIDHDSDKIIILRFVRERSVA